ncbi:hypothetical protein B0H19DRAFT_1073231 [Mycena capillaripes]|nr:hypothetical protein B0H19DRAFT_1073231 [Mycena capillaripes]
MSMPPPRKDNNNNDKRPKKRKMTMAEDREEGSSKRRRTEHTMDGGGMATVPVFMQQQAAAQAVQDAAQSSVLSEEVRRRKEDKQIMEKRARKVEKEKKKKEKRREKSAEDVLEDKMADVQVMEFPGDQACNYCHSHRLSCRITVVAGAVPKRKTGPGPIQLYSSLPAVSADDLPLICSVSAVPFELSRTHTKDIAVAWSSQLPQMELAQLVPTPDIACNFPFSETLTLFDTFGGT